jgi:hypothetical protein
MLVTAVAAERERWRSRMSEVISPSRHRSRAAASPGADQSGGNMDEILKRLGLLEVSMAEMRGTMPHLATKADLSAMETRLIKWLVGATLSSATLAYSVAKLVH